MQFRQRFFKLSALVFAIAALQFGTAAQGAEVAQITVSYADLDLSRSAGIVVLHQRIQSAAQRICAAYEGKSLREHATYHSCKADAAKRAVATVAVPALTNYHNAQIRGTRFAERVAVQ